MSLSLIRPNLTESTVSFTLTGVAGWFLGRFVDQSKMTIQPKLLIAGCVSIAALGYKNPKECMTSLFCREIDQFAIIGLESIGVVALSWLENKFSARSLTFKDIVNETYSFLLKLITAITIYDGLYEAFRTTMNQEKLFFLITLGILFSLWLYQNISFKTKTVETEVPTTETQKTK